MLPEECSILFQFTRQTRTVHTISFSVRYGSGNEVSQIVNFLMYIFSQSSSQAMVTINIGSYFSCFPFKMHFRNNQQSQMQKIDSTSSTISSSLLNADKKHITQQQHSNCWYRWETSRMANQREITNSNILDAPSSDSDSIPDWKGRIVCLRERKLCCLF